MKPLWSLVLQFASDTSALNQISDKQDLTAEKEFIMFEQNEPISSKSLDHCTIRFSKVSSFQKGKSYKSLCATIVTFFSSNWERPFW